jgi:hypothetical protein
MVGSDKIKITSPIDHYDRIYCFAFSTFEKRFLN